MRLVTLERNELQRALAAAQSEAANTSSQLATLQLQLQQSEAARNEVLVLVVAPVCPAPVFVYVALHVPVLGL